MIGAFFFYLLAGIAVLSALAVAFVRNILYAAFALLGALVGVAGLYFFVGADFLGVLQLVIYIGGILVLILFAVLLTRQIGQVRVSNAALGRGAALAPLAALLALLVRAAVRTPWPTTEPVVAPMTARLGDAFLRELLLPFELLSLVLLVALVGAMVIARRAVRDEGPR